MDNIKLRPHYKKQLSTGLELLELYLFANTTDYKIILFIKYSKFKSLLERSKKDLYTAILWDILYYKRNKNGIMFCCMVWKCLITSNFWSKLWAMIQVTSTCFYESLQFAFLMYFSYTSNFDKWYIDVVLSFLRCIQCVF